MEHNRECSDHRCRMIDGANVCSEKYENPNDTESKAENGVLEMIVSCVKDGEKGCKLFGDE